MMLSDNHMERLAQRGAEGGSVLGRAPWPALAALVALAAGACGDAPNTPVAAGDLAEIDADAVIYGMDDHLETDGIRSGRIQADSAYAFNDSSIVHLFGMNMKLFYEDGRDRAEVTALRGAMNQRTEEMVARGDVVVQMANSPERIETPELHYDPAGNRIWSDSATVRVLPDGRTSRGTCFRATLELEDVNICNPRGAVGVPSGQQGRPGSGAQTTPRTRPGPETGEPDTAGSVPGAPEPGRDVPTGPDVEPDSVSRGADG